LAAAGESRPVEGMPSTGLRGRPTRENSKATFREYSAASDTKASRLIGPSMTKGATIPAERKPATKVVVFQCPCGTLMRNR
jgi:hypothetical protein